MMDAYLGKIQNKKRPETGRNAKQLKEENVRG